MPLSVFCPLSSVLRLTLLSILCLLSSVLCLPASAAWSPEAAIRKHLAAHYPWPEVNISELRLSGTLPAEPPSAIVVEKAPPGRSIFRFEFRGGRSVAATALVKTFDRVFMSRAAFKRDYLFRKDDIYPTLMESARIPKGAVRDEGAIIGKPLLRAVVPNVPITDAMVSETPVVKRGRKVTLSVEASGFSIRAAGETKNDAAVGGYVKAVNLVSNKVVAGRLVDENTVVVEY